ncbi:MAG: uncharacterized protein JWQ07_5518 [Ramlibacter sp.]|nr:uncharacterized protein [Ramlibacter sp.]
MTMAEPIAVEWQGRRVAATRPAPIADLDLDVPAATVRLTERAAAAARLAGALATGPAEVAARLLLRSEGLASSAIEGLRASAASVALAQVGAGDGDDGEVADWVADNLAVVNDALEQPGRLDAERLFRWHARLMLHAPDLDDHHRGAYRDRLGWVGGSNPMVAAHVAAPPELIAPAMGDLFAYAARTDVDAVSQAAIVHAQFETIHPFADGNGRLGRVLIGRILAHRLDLTVPPPVSQVFARDIGGYQAGLTLYRQGQAAPWVSWFAEAVRTAAERTGAVLGAIAELSAAWERASAYLRSDAAARRLLPHLPAQPVLSARAAADLLDISTQAARQALATLADAGILVEVERSSTGPGRPTRWWIAQDLLALLGR